MSSGSAIGGSAIGGSARGRSMLTRSKAGVVLALCALLAAPATASAAQAAPAQAQQSGAHEATSTHKSPRCTPRIEVLKTLPQKSGGTIYDPMQANVVNDLGVGSLSVGASRGVPAYWTGTAVHRVPLPTGYHSGWVAAVNHHGLMVGTLFGASPAQPVAFSYRKGASTVRLLPGGAHAADVNDSGHIAGDAIQPGNVLVGMEWVGTTLRRQLPQPADHQIHEVTGINEHGQISGASYGSDENLNSFDVGVVWPASAAAMPVPLNPGVGANIEEFWSPQAIDDSGRVVGDHTIGRLDLVDPVQWVPPYTAYTAAGVLGDRTNGSFSDISRTTNVSVGTASDSTVLGPWPPDTAPPAQAQIWPGSGPVLALPRLTPDGASSANAVADNGKAGGTAADTAGTLHPVVWTCALKQAYPVPPSTQQ
jgi:hypothetical protein